MEVEVRSVKSTREENEGEKEEENGRKEKSKR